MSTHDAHVISSASCWKLSKLKEVDEEGGAVLGGAGGGAASRMAVFAVLMSHVTTSNISYSVMMKAEKALVGIL